MGFQGFVCEQEDARRQNYKNFYRGLQYKCGEKKASDSLNIDNN